jgi:hypothetical protein
VIRKELTSARGGDTLHVEMGWVDYESLSPGSSPSAKRKFLSIRPALSTLPVSRLRYGAKLIAGEAFPTVTVGNMKAECTATSTAISPDHAIIGQVRLPLFMLSVLSTKDAGDLP